MNLILFSTGGLFDDDEADSPFTNPSYIFSSVASHKTDENHSIKQPEAAKSSQAISTTTGINPYPRKFQLRLN